MNFQMFNTPVDFQCNDMSNMIMKAGRNTNLFNNPCNNNKQSTAPLYYTITEDDFIIRCKITPEFKKVYDAGCLIVFENDDKWIKFAYENTDLGYASMVSVVTDETSDDSNGEKMDEYGVWMQLVRSGNNFALHYSLDKEKWKMVRLFRLDMNRKVKVGISAQSPIGDGCIVKFEGLEIIGNNYVNIRKPE